jgi:hypothetical protein
VLEVIAQRTGYHFAPRDFQALDDRDLAHTHYQRLAQVSAGLPIEGMSIRLWTDLRTGALVQAEAQLQEPQEANARARRFKIAGGDILSLRADLSGGETLRITRKAVTGHASPNTDDTRLSQVTWKDQWQGPVPVRVVTAKGRHGSHQLRIELLTQRVLDHRYTEYPQADTDSEFSLRAQLYPIYELSEKTGEILDRVPAELKYIKSRVQTAGTDPYAALRWRRYFENQYDPVLGESELGRAQGYWSMPWLQRQGAALRARLPFRANSVDDGGISLIGRYVTVNLHAAAADRFTGLDFTPGFSSQFRPDWRENLEGSEPVWEMVPSGARMGKPLETIEESWARPARILADHDPATYINDGFDELQVYFAVNQMFDALRPMGFTDPDLAERPFHAFLFDPDISMRNNAYYTDDTINFTTYSAGEQNMARDNPTIWHELGHGVMDRLMGPALHLADTGGLSEGMADFVAQLVVQGVTNGEAFPGSQDFRIINNTGFVLTNEVHDDGEAYGGAMNDFLQAAITAHGRHGLTMVSDLVLEAMRLCRDNPRLTARDWFEHMLFADELGRPGVREAGQLRALILGALSHRNFRLDSDEVATFRVTNVTNGTELGSTGAGSRGRPILVELGAGEEASFDLEAAVHAAGDYAFHYPVTVKVSYNGWALQGGIKWAGEELGDQVFTINSEAELVRARVTATAACDTINRDDGSCVDYAYLQVFNDSERKPVAKKRFYLRVKPKTANPVATN